ncbi:MAG: hypothetical protein ABS75_29515 [Pelagibacterium sp. SCN 63-23]|nr:MAG: hypothetical protein ABS75_29515 [Pelagibacterium sp. SCN 63-23]
MGAADGGRIPSLSAVLVVATGVTGAMIVSPLMNLLGTRNYAARGFAAGIAMALDGAFAVLLLAGFELLR